jgi:hypothetical protein
MYPAHQKLLQASLPVSDEPPLAPRAAVAQSLTAASPRLEHFADFRAALEHPHPVGQVAVAMSFFELFELFFTFLDYQWIVDLWHGHIVPLVRWIGIILHRTLCSYLRCSNACPIIVPLISLATDRRR